MSITGLLRAIAFFLLFLVVALFAALTFMTSRDRANRYPTDGLQSLVIPTFNEQSIDFVPTYDGTKTLPFTAGAIVDIDGDGIEELFLGGGIDQQDACLLYTSPSPRDLSTSRMPSSA